MRKDPKTRELTMVLGKQGRGLLRLKVPHRPRRGVPEGNTFPCPRHHTLASAACPPVPAMRALNSVGRFFLPLVPIETFPQPPIWDRRGSPCCWLSAVRKGRVGREGSCCGTRSWCAGDCPGSQVSPREGAEATAPT